MYLKLSFFLQIVNNGSALFGQISVLWWSDWRNPSRAQAQAIVYGGRSLIIPHTTSTRLSQHEQKSNTGHYIWDRRGCRSCRNLVSVDNQLPSELHYGFSVWIYSHTLFRVRIQPQCSGGFKSVFLPLDILPSPVTRAIYSKLLVMRQQSSTITPSSRQQKEFDQWSMRNKTMNKSVIKSINFFRNYFFKVSVTKPNSSIHRTQLVMRRKWSTIVPSSR